MPRSGAPTVFNLHNSTRTAARRGAETRAVDDEWMPAGTQLRQAPFLTRKAVSTGRLDSG